MKVFRGILQTNTIFQILIDLPRYHRYSAQNLAPVIFRLVLDQFLGFTILPTFWCVCVDVGGLGVLRKMCTWQGCRCRWRRPHWFRMDPHPMGSYGLLSAPIGSHGRRAERPVAGRVQASSHYVLFGALLIYFG